MDKIILCVRCKKNIASVFITKIENGATKNEGICLKCAKELGIKPVNDMMERMGISDDDLENISKEMLTVLGPSDKNGYEPDMEAPPTNAATFPFLDKLFSARQGREPRVKARRARRAAGRMSRSLLSRRENTNSLTLTA